MARVTTLQLLEKHAAILALRCPLRRPARLRLVKSKANHGATYLCRDGFWLTITRGSRAVMLDTLIHEWAHARAWGRGKDHGDKWGIEYARAYRVVIGEDKA